jgi:hypothetical protein
LGVNDSADTPTCELVMLGTTLGHPIALPPCPGRGLCVGVGVCVWWAGLSFVVAHRIQNGTLRRWNRMEIRTKPLTIIHQSA